MEELQAKHRKEQRDLQSKITQKKKNATKRSRKGVNDECDVLQRDLQERQQAELTALGQDNFSDGVQDLRINDGQHESNGIKQHSDVNEVEPIIELHGNSNSLDFSKLSSEDVSLANSEGSNKRPNRQKARLARRAAEQEAQAAQAAEEAAHLPDLREQELKVMKKHLKDLGLTETSIRPDGHCLYSAIAIQLPDEQLNSTRSDTGASMKPYQLVRTTTGNFISNHPDDFSAFLEEPLDVYVSKIKGTAEWGGQLELQAAARAYGVNINVLQADGRVEKIESGSRSSHEPLWLAYYRHSFGLGEHYNALKKIN